MSEAKRTAGRLEREPNTDRLLLPNGGAVGQGVGIENSERLIARWNAFEPGGAVELAREVLAHALADHREWRREAIAALAALDAAREGK